MSTTSLPKASSSSSAAGITKVKISDFRIEIGEIENTLLRVPGVGDATVVVASRADPSKRLVAFYSGPQPLEAGVLRVPARRVVAGVHGLGSLRYG